MKGVKIEAGKIYMLTKTNVKQGTVEEFKARVNWIEDRGDKWYIGYTPEDKRIGKFGTLSIKKSGKFAAINYEFKEI